MSAQRLTSFSAGGYSSFLLNSLVSRAALLPADFDISTVNSTCTRPSVGQGRKIGGNVSVL